MDIEWSTLSVGAWWPFILGLLTLLYFIWLWYRPRGEVFPDFTLISATASVGGRIVDHLAIVLGAVIAVILLVILSSPSIEISRTVERTAREFMILLDSSGSMQADTSVPREGAQLNYQRPLQLGLIPVTGKKGDRGSSVNPETVPYLARYEVARESIREFLNARRLGDRVGIIYFNSTPFIVSIITQNVAAIKEEMKWLDDYVALGTVLHRGLDMAINVLENSPSGLKQALILISDAEISNFNRIETELERLSELNISIHLLWLGEEKGLDAESQRFLDYVGSIGGNIVALKDLTSKTLDAAFANIDRLESYSYVETQQIQVDLSELLLNVTRWIVLLWVLLILTLYHPKSRVGKYEE